MGVHHDDDEESLRGNGDSRAGRAGRALKFPRSRPQRQFAGRRRLKASTSADAPASGTLLSVELSKSLDAKKAKANDRVEARTATDLLAHGHIVVPRNTKIVGHVTEAKAHSKASPDSTIGITFDRMLLKDGREVPLQLTVQAIARPLQLGSPEGNTQRADRHGTRPCRASAARSETHPLRDPPSSYPGDLAPISDPIAPNQVAQAMPPWSRSVPRVKA